MFRSVCVSSADVACRGTSHVSWAATNSWTLLSVIFHLIQKDDLWCFEDSPGDGYPLFLSSAKLQTSFAHLCIITCQKKRYSKVGKNKVRDVTFAIYHWKVFCRKTATFRKAHDFIMDISSYSRLFHLLVTGGDAAIANVVLDGVVKKHRILGNHADVASQRRLLHLRR